MVDVLVENAKPQTTQGSVGGPTGKEWIVHEEEEREKAKWMSHVT
jgi:hypothetical protein